MHALKKQVERKAQVYQPLSIDVNFTVTLLR